MKGKSVQNRFYIHDIRIALIEEGQDLKDICGYLTEMNNNIIKINPAENTVTAELKLFEPEIIIIKQSVRDTEDFADIQKFSQIVPRAHVLLIGKVESVGLYETILKTDIKPIPADTGHDKICEIIGSAAKKIKIARHISIEKDTNGFEEILSSLIHQWKQPLNRLSGLIVNISTANDFGKLTGNYLDKKLSLADNAIKHMSQTLEAFRRFYAHDKMAEEFSLKEIIQETITMARLGLNQKVEFIVDVNDDCRIYGYEKEFFQGLINIINNAIDQLIAKRISNPRVRIGIEKLGTQCRISVTDNAGGIETEPVESVFYPYKSTKGRKGSGLGLYITKHIIEDKMNGTISVSNADSGARFVLTIPTDTIGHDSKESTSQ